MYPSDVLIAVVEVGVVIAKNGRNIKEDYAMNFVGGRWLQSKLTQWLSLLRLRRGH